MNITRNNIWTTPIWYTDIPFETINPNRILEECYEYKKENGGIDVYNCKAWTTKNLIDTLPEHTEQLIRVIEDISAETAVDYGAKNLKPKCLDAWFQINHAGGFIAPHIHRHGPFSAVYYVKTPVDSGGIYFINTSASTYFNKVYLDNNNLDNCDNVAYETKPGRLIIFPSWLIHTSPLNLSDEDRVSFGLDLG